MSTVESEPYSLPQLSAFQQFLPGNILTLLSFEAGLSLVLVFDHVRGFLMRLAVEHIRRMKGGTQAHLMGCDNDEFYVIKFKNKPQHLRTLANEIFATRLAALMGIRVPQVDIVEVRSSLIEHNPDLMIQMRSGSLLCATGKQFGSKSREILRHRLFTTLSQMSVLIAFKTSKIF